MLVYKTMTEGRSSFAWIFMIMLTIMISFWSVLVVSWKREQYSCNYTELLCSNFRFSSDFRAAMLVYRTTAKKVFREFDSIIIHIVYHLMVLVIMSTTSVIMSAFYGLPSTMIVMSLGVICNLVPRLPFLPFPAKRRDLGNEIEPSLYWPQTIYLRSNIAGGDDEWLPYKPHQMRYQETNKAHESLKDEETKKKNLRNAKKTLNKRTMIVKPECPL